MPRRPRSPSRERRSHARRSRSREQRSFAALENIAQTFASTSALLLQEQRSAHQLHGQRQRERGTIQDFDGSTSWPVFRAQFESATHDWQPDARGRRLLQALKGRAANLVQSLPPAHFTDYDRLRDHLQAHFDPVQRRTLASAELDRREQRSGEAVVDFGGDILRLTREAYPSLQEEAIQAIATKRFLDGFADVDSCRTVRLSSPATLNEAITAAVTVEAAYQACPPAHKRPRIGQVSADAPGRRAAHDRRRRRRAGRGGPPCGKHQPGPRPGRPRRPAPHHRGEPSAPRRGPCQRI